MEKDRYFEDLPMLFLQEYSLNQNKVTMEGTQEYPCYVIGQVKEAHDKSIAVIYKSEVGRTRPGFITPKYKHFKKFQYINIFYGGNYLQKINVKVEEIENRNSSDYMYEISWD
jgi:hypothetical protein